jgi:hypothetical protein
MLAAQTQVALLHVGVGSWQGDMSQVPPPPHVSRVSELLHIFVPKS